MVFNLDRKQKASPYPPMEEDSDSEEVIVGVRFVENPPERATSPNNIESLIFVSCNSALSLTKLTIYIQG